MKLKNHGLIVLLFIGLTLGLLNNPGYSKEVEWQTFADGMARSKIEKKKIFLHFYAKWCGACKIMENNTFKNPGVAAYLNENFIPIKVDTDREQQTSTLFRVRMLPDNWFIAEDGKPIGHRPGYITPEKFKGLLKVLLDDNHEQ